jgi:hypothetical protein
MGMMPMAGIASCKKCNLEPTAVPNRQKMPKRICEALEIEVKFLRQGR